MASVVKSVTKKPAPAPIKVKKAKPPAEPSAVNVMAASPTAPGSKAGTRIYKKPAA